MLRRVMCLLVLAGVVLTSATPAEAATVSDPNERPTRLDIRSASVVQISRDEVQITLVFWGRTPQWLLRRHAARIEMSFQKPRSAYPSLGFRFWPNRRGQLRITWGEPASDCCARHGAQHPNPFTYLAVIPFSLGGAVPELKSFRAVRTARLAPCWHAICGLSGGKVIDKTAWVRT